MIKYVHPDRLYPYLGYAWPNKGIAWISWDLTGKALDFIALHETFHLKDEYFYVHGKFRRELRAYWYAFICEPYGALKCVYMVLSSWDRFIGLFEKKEIKWKEG